MEIDPVTYQARPKIDTDSRYNVQFFVRSWEYKLFGVITTDLHLFGLDTDDVRLHLLGTDRFGRDLWGRICLAGRVSLSLSILAALIAIVIGSSVGVISGYYGGAIDNVIQRFVEVVMSFPELPLWMALAAVIPKTWSGEQKFLAMALIFPFMRWAVLAREVRGKVLSLRETDFILAAKEQGASDFRIIFKHLYPNVLSHVIVVLTLLIPSIILAEAFLSFLGIGINEPLTSWGFLMKSAQSLETLGQNTWILTPVIFIVVAVLGLNFLGDGLRDAADPYSNLVSGAGAGMAETAADNGKRDIILKVNDLKMHFPLRQGLLQRHVGTIRAVDGVSFELREQEVMGLGGRERLWQDHRRSRAPAPLRSDRRRSPLSTAPTASGSMWPSSASAK